MSNDFESSIYPAHQRVWNARLGYRIIDADRFKLDANLAYNRFTYDVDTNVYEVNIKSFAAELKTVFIFSDKLEAELFLAHSLHASGDTTTINIGDDQEYNMFGGKLYFIFSDNVSAYLGYQKWEYILIPNSWEDTFSGILVGVKFNF